MSRTPVSERGVALVQVLLITGILAVFAAHLALSSKEQVERAQLLADRAEADLAAESLESTLLFSLLTEPHLMVRPPPAPGAKLPSNPYSDAWNFRGEPFVVGTARLAIRDENGRMLVPRYASGEFERLLTTLGVDPARARRLATALVARQGTGSAGAFPLQSLRELKDLPEMDAALFARLEPMLTLYPAPGFNPLTAPAVLLRARLSDSQAAGVLESRAAGQLDAQQLFRLTGLQADDFIDVLPGPGLTLEIDTAVRGARARRAVTAVVQPYLDEAVTVWARQ